MSAFEQLLDSWRSNPTADATLALCGELSRSPNEELARELGARAEQWHSADAAVMLAVGRMYLDSGLLAESQASLVAAGKGDPRDPRPFRYLGEVLLRRGDAMRSEKVLARAVQLGSTDPETTLWYDRAQVYVALQKRVGAPAVAAEVARTLPQRPAPVPRRSVSKVTAGWTGEEPATLPKAMPGGLAPGARPPVAAPKARSVPPPLPPSVAPPPPRAPAAPPAFQPQPAFQPPPPPGFQPVSPQPVVPAPYYDDADETTVQHRASQQVLGARDAAVARAPAATSPSAASNPYAAAAASAPSNPRAAAPSAQANPFFAPASPGAPGATSTAGRRVTLADAAAPPAELVLEHLARVGVYEPGGGAPPAWESAERTKSRGSWVLVLATVLLVGAGVGAYVYADHVKNERIALAASLGDEVDGLLHSANVEEIRSTDEKLARIFELDSRSQRASKLWLRNRVLSALMLPEESSGIDSAVHRARSLEVPEEETAFGKVASFLVESDLAGAASLLPRWDAKAGKDAYYQLVAGSALERAGDLRAIERYQLARTLDDKLVIAHILHAQLVLLEVGAVKGRPLVEEARTKLGDSSASAKALTALLWVVDPQRDKEPPKEADLSEADKLELPVALRPVPHVVEALGAIRAEQGAKAEAAINAAIGLTVSPAMAAQLGFLAIAAGDEKLARKAALRALQFSALYPRARVLASRVALLGGRLDEAKKAIEELDPSSAEVAVVRAVLAYETYDAGEMASVVEALGDSPEFEALRAGPKVLAGTEYPDVEALERLGSPQVPWGELVAVDAAMDRGELELAEKLSGAWGAGAERPVYSLRLARLRRYQSKPDEALKYAVEALQKGTTTVPVLIELVHCSLAKEDAKGARELIAKYPSLLGPLADWLRVLVDGSSGKLAESKIKAGQLELPPEGAPLPIRALAARALAVAKDKRAKPYAAALYRVHPKHGDVLAAVRDAK